MPKKKRSCVGQQRPKKKRIEQAVADAEESDDLDEDGEAEEAVPPSLPEQPSIPCAPTADSLPIPPPMHVMLEQEKQAAWHEFQTVNRRWRKTIKTHFHADNGGARWATKSELDRVLERLRHADDEHDAAQDQYVRCHVQCVRYRSWRMLKRYSLAQPGKPAIARWRDRAKARYDAARRAALTRGLLDEPRSRPIRDLDLWGAIELVATEVGLAQAFQLVPLSDLRIDLGEPEPPEAIADAKTRADEHYRTLIRGRIERVLQAEKEGSRPRSQRSLMLHLTFCSNRGLVAELLREMGECLCVRPGIERVSDRCEMCRAEGN